jgi:hypothetical protein
VASSSSTVDLVAFARRSTGRRVVVYGRQMAGAQVNKRFMSVAAFAIAGTFTLIGVLNAVEATEMPDATTLGCVFVVALLVRAGLQLRKQARNEPPARAAGAD